MVYMVFKSDRQRKAVMAGLNDRGNIKIRKDSSGPRFIAGALVSVSLPWQADAFKAKVLSSSVHEGKTVYDLKLIDPRAKYRGKILSGVYETGLAPLSKSLRLSV